MCSNIIFVGGATSAILGLTWGGTAYPWGSYQVVVPLIVGFVAMALFIWIEKKWVKHPTVPFAILQNRTSLVGFVTNFIHGVIALAAST
jgi:hypothetical protein